MIYFIMRLDVHVKTKDTSYSCSVGNWGYSIKAAADKRCKALNEEVNSIRNKLAKIVDNFDDDTDNVSKSIARREDILYLMKLVHNTDVNKWKPSLYNPDSNNPPCHFFGILSNFRTIYVVTDTREEEIMGVLHEE